MPDTNPARQDGGPPVLNGPDAQLFRHVLGHYPTGVAVITAMTDRGPVGLSMNSFTSVSLAPPLVYFRGSYYAGITEAVESADSSG